MNPLHTNKTITHGDQWTAVTVTEFAHGLASIPLGGKTQKATLPNFKNLSRQNKVDRMCGPMVLIRGVGHMCGQCSENAAENEVVRMCGLIG